MENQNTFIKFAVDSWQLQIARATNLIESLTDAQLQEPVSPGRNSGVYLLGHLTAIHDAMFTLLDIGVRLYPELDRIFVKNPDSSNIQKPSIDELRTYWKEVNSLLSAQIVLLTPSDWLDRNTSVTVEAYKNEPHRNKLSILFTRTNHVAYHMGQLTFLRKQFKSVL